MRAVFLYGFAKNEKDNIGDDQITTLRDITAEWLAMDATLLELALVEGRVEELKYE